jgi:hypothetical protein
MKKSVKQNINGQNYMISIIINFYSILPLAANG